MWDRTPTDLWDWASLKAKIAETGVRNSLLVAPMPTASTSQILGFNECFEPYTSNIYSRRVLAGEFQVVNPWLLKDLVDLGLWSDNMKNRIIADGGSVQNIPNIPADIKALYKTVWEISQRNILQMAADRGAYIDQSQSLNIHLKEPTMGKITSMHFAGWKMGLKTGMYYLRTMAASAPIQFTVDQEQLKVEDTNVARSKKRAAGTATAAYSAVPRPGAQSATANVAIPEESPRTLVADPMAAASREPNLPAAEVNSDEAQPEDAAAESEAREGDIFSDAVLQCSIENKEACVMCQG
jgi:ribonucleoside-diphosphate reductase subunit M1